MKKREKIMKICTKIIVRNYHSFFSRSGNFGHHQVTQQSDLHFKMNSNNDNLKNQNASF